MGCENLFGGIGEGVAVRWQRFSFGLVGCGVGCGVWGLGGGGGNPSLVQDSQVPFVEPKDARGDEKAQRLQGDHLAKNREDTAQLQMDAYGLQFVLFLCVTTYQVWVPALICLNIFLALLFPRLFLLQASPHTYQLVSAGETVAL